MVMISSSTGSGLLTSSGKVSCSRCEFDLDSLDGFVCASVKVNK